MHERSCSVQKINSNHAGHKEGGGTGSCFLSLGALQAAEQASADHAYMPMLISRLIMYSGKNWQGF